MAAHPGMPSSSEGPHAPLTQIAAPYMAPAPGHQQVPQAYFNDFHTLHFRSQLGPLHNHFQLQPTSPKQPGRVTMDTFSFPYDPRMLDPSLRATLASSFTMPDLYASHMEVDTGHDTGTNPSRNLMRLVLLQPLAPPMYPRMLGPHQYSQPGSQPHEAQDRSRGPHGVPHSDQLYPPHGHGETHQLGLPADNLYNYPADMYHSHYGNAQPKLELHAFLPPRFDFGRAFSLDDDFTSTYSSNGPSPFAISSDDPDFTAAAHHADQEAAGRSHPSQLPLRLPDQLLPQVGPQRQVQERKKRNSVPTGEAAARSRCPICKKQFKRPSSVQTHIYSHTGQKCFKCPWKGCGREFNVKSNMTRHYKLHERDERRST